MLHSKQNSPKYAEPRLSNRGVYTISFTLSIFRETSKLNDLVRNDGAFLAKAPMRIGTRLYHSAALHRLDC